jgi:hypothetical protein
VFYLLTLVLKTRKKSYTTTLGKIMKQKLQILLSILILTFSCVKKNEQKKSENEINIGEKKEIINVKKEFENRFEIDTTLVKKNLFGNLKISNSKRKDSILSLCQCKKYKKDNRIKIQVKTAIPTKKELDTMSENFKKRNRYLQLSDLGYLKKISGQFKFLTIILKDSIVESINLYSKSTEKEYNGVDFDSLSIKKYKINISKFNYSIASNIYGNFELHLNKEFGFFENDTILKSDFLCNNWVITEKENIKNWNIKESFEKRHNDRGFRIIE